MYLMNHDTTRVHGGAGLCTGRADVRVAIVSLSRRSACAKADQIGLPLRGSIG